MDKVSYVGNADLNAIDHLYKQYQKDPNSIDSGWVKFFEGFEFAQANYEDGGEIPENFQKEFIFNICPENFVTQLDGYVTEKLFMACCCGNIPIYYGKLDDLDKQIFNLNRIILYDPTNDQSIDQVYTIIKKLLFNFQDLYNYYKQDVFLPSAIEIIKNYKVNLNKRLNEFIKNSTINYIDGKLN